MSDDRAKATTSSAGDALFRVFSALYFHPLFQLFVMGPAGAWGFAGLVILLIVCGYQTTPGVEFVDVGWPKITYGCIAGVAGAIVGGINARRRILGMLAGATAALGALWSIAFLFENVPAIPANRVWAWVSVIALAVGIVPGVVLYGLFDRGAIGASQAKQGNMEVGGKE